MSTLRRFDLTVGFRGDVLPPVSYEEALHRVQAYCTDPKSGWATYDLCGVEARRAGMFKTLTPWSLLWADALAGQVRVGDISSFTIAKRQKLAGRIAAVPEDQDLDGLAPESVVLGRPDYDVEEPQI